MRTEKSARNLFYGEANIIFTVLLSMVTRTTPVRVLGLSAASLNGLFAEVIAVLPLAELGMGFTITYHLYRPLAEHDRKKVVQLTWFYRSAYRMIAGAILISDLVFLPFVPQLIRDAAFNARYLRLAYVIFLLKTVSSYFFSYKRTLLDADQKMHPAFMTNTVFRFITATPNLGILILTQNFIAYLLSDGVVTVANNIAIAHIADRQYPFLKETRKLPKEGQKKIFFHIRQLFIGILSGKTTSSTDNILISVLMGTLQVGPYSNYSLIVSNVKRILLLILDVAAGSIRNLAVSKTRERCHQVLCQMTFIIFMVTSFCASCTMCMSDPFVEILLGREYLIDDILKYSFVVNFFYYVIREPLWRMMLVSGLFSRDKNISIAGSSIDLIVPVALGSRWGILGTMLGTTCTLVIQTILRARLPYRELFYMDLAYYQEFMVKISAAGLSSILVCKMFCDRITLVSPYGRLGVYFAMAGSVSMILSVVCFRKMEEFRYYRDLAAGMFQKNT